MLESIRNTKVVINSHINHFSGYGHQRVDNIDQMQRDWSSIIVEMSKLTPTDL